MKLLKNPKLLALIIFAFGFFQRILLDLAFWEKYGFYASHLTEIWTYCKKAFTDPLKYDITIYLLKLTGKLFGEKYILHGVSVLAAILSSLTAVIIFYLVKNLMVKRALKKDYFIPLAAALFYTGIASVQALSVVSFTHDLVQLPVTLGFLTAAIASINYFIFRRKNRLKLTLYLSLSLVLALIGYHINPVFFISLPLLLVYFVFSLGKSKRIYPQIIFYVILITILIFSRYIFYNQAIQILHNILHQYKGIDLIYILGQNSRDLVPTDMDKKFLDLYILLFFIPFGFYAALKKREGLAPTFLIISYFIASTVDRGSRLLNISAAIVAAYAFCYQKKFYIADYAMAGILIITLLLNPGASMLNFGDKFVFVLIALVTLWAYKKYFQKYNRIVRRKAYYLALIILLLVPSFSALFLYKYWIKPTITHGEYEMAKWIKDNTKAGEKIFLNWGEAQYYEFLTNLKPINRLAQTGFDQNKIYWQSEEQAVAYAKEQGIRYFLVNSNDFALQKVPYSDNVVYRFRGVTPPSLTREDLTTCFLYDMVIEPQNLEKVELVHEEEDKATGKWVRLYKISN